MSDQKPPAKPAGLTIEQLFKALATKEDTTQPQKTMEEYKFWKTQPVPKLDSEVQKEGPIENKTVEEVEKQPYGLLSDFDWCTMDIEDAEQVKEIYDLLYHNYIEDADEEFRFKYSPEFLDWALKPPGWFKEWNVGVRVKSSNKLIAFISGVPATVQVRDNEPVKIAEINFLCVHKKLRSKRLAPLLIKEVTRRVNQENVWQALYTAGIVLPSPVATCRYYHRSINWQKLYDVGFSPLPVGSTPAKQTAKYALPAELTNPNFRPLTKEDIPAVHKLLTEYVQRFEIKPVFTESELEHLLLGSKGVVFAYVVEKEAKITDFVSFYCMESSVLGNPKHDTLKVAYAYYYASDVVVGKGADFEQAQLQKRLQVLFQNALIMAKKHQFDVFNALTLQDNPLFLDDLKFGCGDGFLHYYLFNYQAFKMHGGYDKTKTLEYRPDQGVGVVML